MINEKLYYVYDDIIDKKLQDEIEQRFLKSDINWFYHNTPTDLSERDDKYYHFKKNNSDIFEGPQFVHMLYTKSVGVKSPHVHYAESIFKSVASKFELGLKITISRIKANLQTSINGADNDKYTAPHCDENNKHYVILYYINDSDGDTFLFENDENKKLKKGQKLKVLKRITPKKGRAVLFDGSILHASSVPVKSKNRMVFNIDFDVERTGDSESYNPLLSLRGLNI
tara:strand:+ start:4269 stop:4949 length:681 start_codon:yes stop_codon:yes gene_type:complete